MQWKQQKISIETTIQANFLACLDKQYDYFCFLNSNGKSTSYLALGSQKEFCSKKEFFVELSQFIEKNKDWVFGVFGYDLKNEIEQHLSSNNNDSIDFPDYHFFIPELIIEFDVNKQTANYYDDKALEKYKKILNQPFDKEETNKIPEVDLKQKVSKKEYLKNVAKIQENIKKGDIYELNYCHEFYAYNVSYNPVDLYLNLNSKTNAPFSAFYKINSKYIISASPERFIKKEGEKVISQPIKGTAKRGKNKKEDLAMKLALENNQKERSENIMIVDLVRNDLAKTAQKDTVKVKELCKVYSYDTVHQLVSTVESMPNTKFSSVDILKNCFPMGSMTGAPKVEAMKLIEQYENSKRGLYSGAIGYFNPKGDFDFNVVIRTILYNQETKTCSFMVGGAITLQSKPEEEYQETLLKAQALKQALGIK